MKGGLQRYTKLLWVAACVVVLVVSIVSSDPQDKHSLLLLFYPMIILSFPCGLVVPYIIGGLALVLVHFGIERPYQESVKWEEWYYVMHTIYWGVFAFVGYLQWFRVFPYIKKKWLKSG
jgi:hypothetical protein